MTRPIFMLEEPSMKALLEGMLPRLVPGVVFKCVTHEGKGDLLKSLPRKLKNWQQPGDRFVVICDNDGGDCKQFKASLAGTARAAGRGDTVIRLVCQELEAWYFGDPAAMVAAFGKPALGGIGRVAGFRDPDAIGKPSRELKRLHPAFQKIDGARRMAETISYQNNTSRSFRVMIEAVSRISGCALSA